MEQTVRRHTDPFERSRIAEIVLVEYLRAQFAQGTYAIPKQDLAECWVIADDYLEAGVQHRKEKARAQHPRT